MTKQFYVTPLTEKAVFDHPVMGGTPSDASTPELPPAPERHGSVNW